jgi:hypothetical protein
VTALKRKFRVTPPKEVFLSHSARDRRFVERLAQTLREHGIRVWYSERHIRGGQRWFDEIGSALKRCDWFVVVLSPNSIRSVWVKRELLYAFRQPRFEDRIVPLLHVMCSTREVERLAWTLSGLQRVDFRGSFAQGCRELLRIWGIRYEG